MDDKAFDARYNLAPTVFKDWMKGRLDFSDTTILDFGCDSGVMTLGIMNHCNPKRVIGVDINDHHKNLLDEISKRLNMRKLPCNLEFYVTAPDENLNDFLCDRGEIDCIFSWSVFEHVSQPVLEKMISELYKTLRKGGYCFIQIAPLYYSPFGSHLETLISEPWAHLTVQLNLLHSCILNSPKVGPYMKEDDVNFEKIKNALWSTYSTLNKITADELIHLFEITGFVLIEQYRTHCSVKPNAKLNAIYNHEVLTTEQIVGLFRKM